MKKGNILFLGNSGVGKTTLINSILGTSAATGFGIEGTTKALQVYENEEVPFRIIDTIGFEPTKAFQQNKAIKEVQKWCKRCASDGDEQTTIDLICICVDGTSSKLFPKTIDDFLKSIAIWKTVPIIAIITKSYSQSDKEANVKMVEAAFANRNRSIKGIYPVVASPYLISNDYAVPAEGVTELIEAINELLPEGIQASRFDVDQYNLERKRRLAHSSVVLSTGAGVTVGAVPIPFPDALILVPIETALINALAKIYGIEQNEKSKTFFNTIIEVGTVSVVARGLITALKAIPGINVAASVLNAIIAGAIVAAIGEGSIFAFERIYLGLNSIEDIDWVKKIMEDQMGKGLIEKITKALQTLPESPKKNDIMNMLLSVFNPKATKRIEE
ncbi:MAG: GTP-binding DUF697 domain-containing protein [Saccharofermentans sp.]|nr:GTP-binding DUF697 domain-containing protein [Saccharofermentans sp.]